MSILATSTAKRTFFVLFGSLPPRGPNPLYRLPLCRTVPDRRSDVPPTSLDALYRPTSYHPLIVFTSTFSRRVMDNMFLVMRSMIRFFFLYKQHLTMHSSTCFSYSKQPCRRARVVPILVGLAKFITHSVRSPVSVLGSENVSGRFRNRECCPRDDQLLSRLVGSCTVP